MTSRSSWLEIVDQWAENSEPAVAIHQYRRSSTRPMTIQIMALANDGNQRGGGQGWILKILAWGGDFGCLPGFQISNKGISRAQ